MIFAVKETFEGSKATRFFNGKANEHHIINRTRDKEVKSKSKVTRCFSLRPC